MNETVIGRRQTMAILKDMIGRTIQYAAHSGYSTFNIDVGTLILRRRKRYGRPKGRLVVRVGNYQRSGSVRILVFSSDWRARSRGGQRRASSVPWKANQRWVQSLNGKKITSIAVNGINPRIQFSNGYELTILTEFDTNWHASTRRPMGTTYYSFKEEPEDE